MDEIKKKLRTYERTQIGTGERGYGRGEGEAGRVEGRPVERVDGMGGRSRVKGGKKIK